MTACSFSTSSELLVLIGDVLSSSSVASRPAVFVAYNIDS